VTVREVAADYRRRLLLREAVALLRIREAWTSAELVILDRLIELLERMADESPRRPISWLLEAERAQRLLAQIAGELGKASDATTVLITGAQGEAVAMAAAAGAQYYEASGGFARIGVDWNRLPAGAVEELVGRFSDGSPLKEAFQKYPAVAVARMEEQLVTGIARGKNPREVAREIRKANPLGLEIADGPGQVVQEQTRLLRQRSELIARTEIVGSHRAAAVANYRTNFESCIGYRRVAALDVRTCAACWALHGKLYPLAVDPHEHPQCRCAVVPEFDTSDPIESGPGAFDRLADADKREILGPAKFELYKRGEAGLEDFAETFEDTKWGPQVREKSLRRLTQVQ